MILPPLVFLASVDQTAVGEVFFDEMTRQNSFFFSDDRSLSDPEHRDLHNEDLAQGDRICPRLRSTYAQNLEVNREKNFSLFLSLRVVLNVVLLADWKLSDPIKWE